ALQSGSRSGVLAVLAVATVMCWRTVRASRLVALGIGGAAALLLFGFPTAASPAVARLTESDLTQNSNQERLALADKGIAQVRLNPVFGTGLPKTDLPHNVILLVWGGMGLIGLIAFLVLVVHVVRGALGSPRGPERWLLSLSAFGFLIVVSLNNSIGTPVAWFVIGLLQTTVVRVQRQPASGFDVAGGAHLARTTLLPVRSTDAAPATPTSTGSSRASGMTSTQPPR
nr:O-antigen ligase family protein [Propionibacteriales bacterium]